jgi:hypothetical protein
MVSGLTCDSIKAEYFFLIIFTTTVRQSTSEKNMKNTFNQSAWAREEFSKNYLEKADIYVIERRKMIGIMASLFTYFLHVKRDVHVLDLGSGDGVLTEELIKNMISYLNIIKLFLLTINNSLVIK